MLKERRRDGRIFFDMPAELTIAGASYPVEQIANLSLGGCLLGIKDNLQIGVECNLTIVIDNTPPGLKIDVNGVIVRNDSETTAIQFIVRNCPNATGTPRDGKQGAPCRNYTM